MMAADGSVTWEQFMRKSDTDGDYLEGFYIGFAKLSTDGSKVPRDVHTSGR